MSKMPIRFYKDREVRAVWDDETNEWWFYLRRPCFIIITFYNL